MHTCVSINIKSSLEQPPTALTFALSPDSFFSAASLSTPLLLPKPTALSFEVLSN
jgi:hypothetical protein